MDNRKSNAFAAEILILVTLFYRLTVAVTQCISNTSANTSSLLSVTRLNTLTYVLLSRYDQYVPH